MPITSTIRITGSVGANGRNVAADVKLVQQRLNDLSRPPLAKLVVDGLVGPRTKALIADFQTKVLGLRMPDSRVDPNGRTLAALNNAQSENLWAGQGAPSAGVGGMTGLNPMQQQRYQQLMDELKRRPDTTRAQQFLVFAKDNRIDTIKIILNGQGALQYLVEAFLGINTALRVFSPTEILQILTDPRIPVDDGLRVLASFKDATRLVNALKALAEIALVIQIIVTAIIALKHFRAGNYGAGFGEIYSTAMAAAVPVAGFLNAMQGLIVALNPSIASNPNFGVAFRYLLAIDPIGAGTVAVDTYVTFTKAYLTALYTGKINTSDFTKLIDRMRASPMKFWVDIGESMAEWEAEKFGDWYRRNILDRL